MKKFSFTPGLMHGLPRRAAAALVLLAVSCVRSPQAPPVMQQPADNTPGVIITRTSPDNASQYSIEDGACLIQWTAYTTEANRGVVKHWTRCPDPLAAQMPMLAKICAEFFSKDANAQAFRTLFWGGLEPDSGQRQHELPLRLALAAHASPDWDVKRGRPRGGDINGFVVQLANKAMIYPELKDLFARFHKSIRFSCAEKVRVMKASELPFFDRLREHGVTADEKLPFDCMTWFSVAVEQ